MSYTAASWDWIRPAGYFRVKARRLRAFTTMVAEKYDGRLTKLFDLDTKTLREELLEFYRPHNERLYELLGVDFGWN